MIGIYEFVTARLDEDEKTVTGLQSMIRSLSELNDRMPPDSRRGTQVYDAGAWALARMLADITAKRLMIEAEFDYAQKIDGEWGCAHSAADIRDGKCLYTGPDDLPIMRALANVYADHPDFKSEWAWS